MSSPVHCGWQTTPKTIASARRLSLLPGWNQWGGAARQTIRNKPQAVNPKPSLLRHRPVAAVLAELLPASELLPGIEARPLAPGGNTA